MVEVFHLVLEAKAEKQRREKSAAEAKKAREER
jgi:hypothetical protein